MPETNARRILKHVGDKRYRPQSVLDLAHELGVDPQQLEAFKESVEQLVDSGGLVLNRDNAVTLPPPGPEIVGKFRLNPRGFGFVEPEDPQQHRDLFIPPPFTSNALSGDRVRAAVRTESSRGRGGPAGVRYVGEIVEVLQRSDNKYVGNLTKKGSTYLVHVDGNVLPGPVVIRDPGAKNADEGDKVVIELITPPEDREPGEGVIVEKLGESGVPDVETQAVMRAYGLVEAFESDVMEQARTAAHHFDADRIPSDRQDLTNTFTCTIDPPDAKDYDDAISIRRIEDPVAEGLPSEAAFELGIHIADVAHFVALGTALDEAAYRRGNSSYLPRRVVPMLPELLSNGVCSLQEGVHRYAKSAFLLYDEQGRRLSKRFCRSVIRSDKRLTYLEAQALIDDDLREAYKHAKTEPKYPRELVGKLKLMNELAGTIRRRRFDDGMIVLDLPEVELIYDDAGNVIDAEPEDDAFTHRIIEMFMVEANEAVAELFDALDIPMIRRIHPDPAAHDMNELRMFARVAGHNVPAHPSRKELQALLDSVAGKPAQHAVHLAVLQTLSKAEYSPLLVGHFALGSEHYTHFTSPIRRYPDLIVHRGLEAYFDHHPEHFDKPLPGGKGKSRLRQAMEADDRCPDEQRLQEMGKHCSTTERNSESAERDLGTYLVLERLAQHMGDDYAGTVSGLSNDSLWIQLDKYLVDGQVRVADLSESFGNRHENWQLNRTSGTVVGQKSGRTISIGDRFTVRISNVDPVMRKLGLFIVPDEGGKKNRGTKQKKRRQPPGARKSHQQSLHHKQQGKQEKPGKPPSGQRKGRR